MDSRGLSGPLPSFGEAHIAVDQALTAMYTAWAHPSTGWRIMLYPPGYEGDQAFAPQLWPLAPQAKPSEEEGRPR